MKSKQPAVVLLGPTGSGKTPLGQQLKTHRLWGRRCVHFDFGESLRTAVARNEPDDCVTAADLALLRRVLRTGALLEDDDFPIAARLLSSFLQRMGADGQTWVIMNGLPRHVGQAEALMALLDVQFVVVLRCTKEVVHRRIARNTGGDRTDRVDDDLSSIRRNWRFTASGQCRWWNTTGTLGRGSWKWMSPLR